MESGCAVTPRVPARDEMHRVQLYTECLEPKTPMQQRGDILSLSTTLLPKFRLLSRPFVQMGGPEVDFADLFYCKIAAGICQEPPCGFHFFTPFYMYLIFHSYLIQYLF